MRLNHIHKVLIIHTNRGGTGGQNMPEGTVHILKPRKCNFEINNFIIQENLIVQDP